MNASWIRENLTTEQFADRLHHWLLNRDYLMKFLPMAKERVERLSDFAPIAAFMFSGMLNLSPEDFAHKKLEAGDVKKVLQFTLWKLEQLRQWQRDQIFAEIKGLSKAMDIKLGDFNHPVLLLLPVRQTPGLLWSPWRSWARI